MAWRSRTWDDGQLHPVVAHADRSPPAASRVATPTRPRAWGLVIVRGAPGRRPNVGRARCLDPWPVVGREARPRVGCLPPRWRDRPGHGRRPHTNDRAAGPGHGTCPRQAAGRTGPSGGGRAQLRSDVAQRRPCTLAGHRRSRRAPVRAGSRQGRRALAGGHAERSLASARTSTWATRALLELMSCGMARLHDDPHDYVWTDVAELPPAHSPRLNRLAFDRAHRRRQPAARLLPAAPV